MTDAAPSEATGPRRAGFVAVLGAPNAGKSTLVNRLVGTKVSIVSPKVQTTRRRVLGIVLVEDCQLILVDLPGVFAPRRRLDRAMVSAAWRGAEDADVRVVLVDAGRKLPDAETELILDGLRERNSPALLALNKIDLIRRERLLGLSAALNSAYPFAETFMISALTGDGVDDLLRALVGRMPAGPWLYPEDQISDLPERLFAAEVTREKLYLQLRQELPYAATVETESWEEFRNGDVRIAQVVYVERDSQKAIVLGRQGSRIKALGEAARRELETHLERRVHLRLYVKVRDRWTDDPERYQEMGLEFGS